MQHNLAAKMSLALSAMMTLALITTPAKTTAQQTDWDSPHALQLMEKARLRRAAPLADTTLHNYRGTAEGYLYFYGDRPSGDERLLVRVDQVGLDMFWRQPGTWRQRIVGMRHASELPNGIRYHLDHFTMVQNGFGNVIRVGGGDEVRDVLHPAAPGSGDFYQFRLADSLDLMIDGRQRIHVYEVQVRPRDGTKPAMAGSVFLDQASGAVVRMSFTFTRAAYVGNSIDYINISLDNALYGNKYWLANEQLVEIRRAIPLFDLGVGTVVRSRIRVKEYELNAVIDDSIFRAPPIVRGRRARIDGYAFERGIYDDMRDAGLSQPPPLSELRREAETLVKQELLTALPPIRFYVPGVSSILRYNRAEGVYLGLGVSYVPAPSRRYDILTGYALGSDRGSLHARAARTWGSAARATDVMLEGYVHRSMDLDPIHIGTTVGNTLSAALAGTDYLDLWYVTGLKGSVRRSMSSAFDARISAGIGDETSATRVKERAIFNRGATFREVLAIDEGLDRFASLAIERRANQGRVFVWDGSLRVTAGSLDERRYVRPELDLTLDASGADRDRTLHMRAVAATTSTSTIAQQLFLLGGRGTLPGYRYRSFAGRRGALVDGVLTQALWRPWVGLRLRAAAGATDALAGTTAETLGWPVAGTGGIRTSAGIGTALVWNTFTIDAMRGLNGGRWVLEVSAARAIPDNR